MTRLGDVCEKIGSGARREGVKKLTKMPVSQLFVARTFMIGFSSPMVLLF